MRKCVKQSKSICVYTVSMFRTFIHKSPHFVYIPLGVGFYINFLIPPNQPPPPKPFQKFVIPPPQVLVKEEKNDKENNIKISM
jgi:hypothetical protein